ncbi:glycoside hydrolase family 3 C-terminal domain-containing protein [Clostridium thermarum]|uniref:glycoside hydrolase family 3 C-terminal domain-containing protein n=1 Tax=Clostridium thermarum TaxID=1716543 RepID=UPI0013D7223F|nr:glycoside hydrolase family 3 C-terminal domain-containing protein [Clostridium thermarum]
MNNTENISIENKIEELLKKMTLEEKVGLIHGNGLFRTEGVERLGIPALKMSDGPMGVRREFPNDNWNSLDYSDDYVTYLPSNTALAATWNRDLAYESGKVLGAEARGRGKDIILAPGINIVRSPLCGRNFEYMSEDPYLAGAMAVPYIKGVQENHVAACVKHFALNNQETERLNVNVEVDERALREIYLPAFEAAVKEGKSYTIMSAYNKFRGTYCSHSNYLLDDILKGEWGYDGVVISDWGAVHDTYEAANCALDIEMNVTNNFDEYFLAKPLIEAVKAGKVDEKVIDEKARRILRLMHRINIFEEGRYSGAYNTAEHREKTLRTAREAIVLLKNDNSVLPLDKNKIKTLAVIGENAEKLHALGGGSAEIKALYEISPLLGLKMKLGGNVEVKYAKGYSENEAQAQQLLEEALDIAEKADAVIFVGGLTHKLDTEGLDKPDLKLPYGQDVLIEKLLQANENTVIVMLSGTPVDMGAWLEKASAVVQTWYNGMEGGYALAEVLLGDVNPSGKLPVTFPKRLEDSPAHSIGEFPGRKDVHYREGIFVGYRHFSTNNVEPLFWFGHGLSYTTFEYNNIKLTKEEREDNIRISVCVDIKNTGNRDGAEVVQLYIRDVEASVVRPVKELKGFQKLYLKSGESSTAELVLDKTALAFYNEIKHCWQVEAGKFEILIGSSSEDIRQRAIFTVDKDLNYI